jgi:N4-gp56 family major capsid protein
MNGQSWAISADGGYFANPKLSKKMRHANQPKMVFRQFTRIEPGIGKNAGDTLDFNKMSNVQTQGGKITELQDIPETKMLIRRGTLVLDEWGNSIPFTGKLETLSEFDSSNIFQKGLMNDQRKVLDKAAADELKTTKLIYTPLSDSTGEWVSDGSADSVALSNWNYFHHKEVIDAMMSGEFGSATGNPVPPMEDGNYVAVYSVKAARGIFDDPDYVEAARYAQPRKLFAGEVENVVYNCRIMVTNNAQALSNGVGSSNVMGEVLYMGDDVCMEGVAIAEELRSKLPVKYGRDHGIAWYAILGFQKTWDLATDGEEHIVYGTSA